MLLASVLGSFTGFVQQMVQITFVRCISLTANMAVDPFGQRITVQWSHFLKYTSVDRFRPFFLFFSQTLQVIKNRSIDNIVICNINKLYVCETWSNDAMETVPGRLSSDNTIDVCCHSVQMEDTRWTSINKINIYFILLLLLMTFLYEWAKIEKYCNKLRQMMQLSKIAIWYFFHFSP